MKAVIFDFNGTLIFDTELHSISWKQMAKEIRGTDMSDEEFNKINGTTNKYILEFIFQREITVEESEKYAQRKEELYRDLLRKSSIELCSGAIELFESLQQHQIPFTIATSSDWGNVQCFIEKYHLEKWFDIDKIVFNDFTFKGKPFPDIYLKAAKVLNVDISDCIVFEDTISGIQSGYSAGACCVGIASELSTEKLCSLDGCCHAIHSFNEVTIDQLNELMKKFKNL